MFLKGENVGKSQGDNAQFRENYRRIFGKREVEPGKYFWTGKGWSRERPKNHVEKFLIGTKNPNPVEIVKSGIDKRTKRPYVNKEQDVKYFYR